jgi:hypothetical protein
MVSVRSKDEERFWKKVRKTSGCWNWIGDKHALGYGFFKVKGSRKLAHRISVIFSGRRIPPGKVVDHLCRNPRCVNPAHLDVTSQRENILRGTAPAAFHAKKTRCPNGHPYDSSRIRKYGTARHCSICETAYGRDRYLKIQKPARHALSKKLRALGKMRGLADHGGAAMYNYHKCRCEKCRAWRNDYQRERRKKGLN